MDLLGTHLFEDEKVLVAQGLVIGLEVALEGGEGGEFLLGGRLVVLRLMKGAQGLNHIQKGLAVRWTQEGAEAFVVVLGATNNGLIGLAIGQEAFDIGVGALAAEEAAGDLGAVGGDLGVVIEGETGRGAQLLGVGGALALRFADHEGQLVKRKAGNEAVAADGLVEGVSLKGNTTGVAVARGQGVFHCRVGDAAARTEEAIGVLFATRFGVQAHDDALRPAPLAADLGANARGGVVIEIVPREDGVKGVEDSGLARAVVA